MICRKCGEEIPEEDLPLCRQCFLEAREEDG